LFAGTTRHKFLLEIFEEALRGLVRRKSDIFLKKFKQTGRATAVTLFYVCKAI
jgi:hypothetical protein